MTSRLRVSLADNLSPPSAEHQLLVAFHFGATPAPDMHSAIVSPRLHPIDCETLYEAWWVDDDVHFSTHGNLRIADSSDYAVIIFEADESDTDDHQRVTHDAYRELLSVVSTMGNTRLVKIWNYLGGINEGEGDLERYRQFSVGRAIAFRESGIDDEHSPTGTGVGMMQKRGLSIIALCSKREFTLAENPRQISAFRYPRQYGPQSPKFGRGGSVLAQDHRLHLLSGTASIVGHESMHPGDTGAQFDETLRNLDSLCDAISEAVDDVPKLILDDQCVLRVYLRNAGDYLAVANNLRDRLGPGASRIAFLHGEICRRELMVEIDGIRVQ